jgi:hypothetical protein
VEAVTPGTELKAREMLATPDLIAVGVQGDEVRRTLRGTTTTFVRVFEMHVDAPPSALPPTMTAGELRIVGQPTTVEAAVAAVRSAAALAAGRMPVTGYSLPDLRRLGPDVDGFRSLCRALEHAGLTAVADMPLDAFLDDAGAEEAVRVARGEGLGVFRLTVHRQLAGTDDADERVALVERARRAQVELGGFLAFAPLPRTMSIAQPTTGYQDIRHVALARVIVDNIPSIQVDWPLYGPKLAQVALTVGADDVDGVAAVDSGALGTRRSPIEEIKHNIRAAALEPVERNGRFELMA